VIELTHFWHLTNISTPGTLLARFSARVFEEFRVCGKVVQTSTGPVVWIGGRRSGGIGLSRDGQIWPELERMVLERYRAST
jgi:hypothetical protein